MSGSTIGGIIGAGIGWALAPATGGASLYIQAGFLAGSMVGGYIDPQRFETPRINDFSFQSSQDGVPRVYGYGTYPVDQTWLMWRSDVRHVRKKKRAKGGSEQVTNSYFVSYAISTGAGGISGFKLIEEDGKIVFDARTDAELTALGYTAQQISETRAAQAKFLENVEFYYGTPDQMPDPTMVAVEGAGEVPAYRDTAYFVVKDKDITSRRSIPTYRVVKASCGERTEDFTFGDLLLVTGQSKFTGGPRYAVAAATAAPNFEGVPRDTGAEVIGLPAHYEGMAVVAGSQPAGEAGYSFNIDTSWIDSESGPVSAQGVVGGHAGWLAYNQILSLTGAGFWYAAPTPTDWANYYPDTGVWHISYAAGYYWLSAPGVLRRASFPQGPWTVVASGVGIYDWIDIIEHGGELYATCKANSGDGSDWLIKRSHDGGATWPDTLLTVAAIGHRPYFLCQTNAGLFAWCIGGGLWSSVNGWSEWIDIGIDGSGTTSQLWQVQGGRKIVYAGDRLYVIGTGDDLAVVNPETLAVTLATLPIQSLIGITVVAPPDAYQPIPDAPGYYIEPTTGEVLGPPGIAIDPCQPTLGEIVADKCESRGVPRDVSELPDPVTGYRVAGPSTAQRIIQGLQPGYLFGCSEFDGLLHFPKRGRPLTFALTEDDFVSRDGGAIQWERTQEGELLRKLTVAYIDPAVNYTTTTQMAERRATTIAAEGESTMELAITGSQAWAAQVADKGLKVAWGEPDQCTFHVSIAHAELVPCAEGTVPYRDGSTVVVRIERIEDEGLVRMVTARRTRSNLYQSNAAGTAKPLPAFPGSNIRGPVDGLLMNIPVLRDANDVPGIHWAAAGFTSGYVGAQFQILRAGEWVVAGETTFAANTGTLLAPLPYHAGDMDTANVLHVGMGDELESITYTQLLQERNPMAILRPDGTAEIVQPQTCVEVAPGEFECTTILRNRLDSGASAHAAGARVVFLDEAVEYATLQPTDIGQTLSYRFVSLGTDPDAAPVQTLDLATMESQREWPVADLSVAVDGGDYTLTWQPRHRLGSDVFPVRSTNWTSYAVGYSHPGGSGSVVVTTESHTFTLPGATDITFSVAQVNQFTGAGPAETVHIP